MLATMRSLPAISMISLLWLLCWPFAGAASLLDTCRNGPISEAAIGIDFGNQFVIASEAHSLTNFSLVAVVSNEEYRSQVMHLGLEFYERTKLDKLFSGLDPTPLSLLKILVTEVLWLRLVRLSLPITSRFPILKHPAVRRSCASVRRAFVTVYKKTRKLAQFVGLLKGRKAIPLPDALETFTNVFKEIKASVWEQHNRNLTFAVVSVPDFFNETLMDIVLEASERAGVAAASQALPRTFSSYYLRPELSPSSKVLVIHQGLFHCGVRMSEEASRRRDSFGYMPLDPWASRTIDRDVAKRAIQSSPELQKQLSVGADMNALTAEIQIARFRLKNRDVAAEILGMGEQPAGSNEDGNNEGPFDDFPLDLESWWVYGSYPGVNLRWEDVKAAEDRYVGSLAGSLKNVLRAARQMRTGLTESMQLEQMDVGFVLTDHGDGELVRRAMKKAIGPDFPVLGGTLRNITMAADGAARIAWKRRDNMRKIQGFNPFQGNEEL